MKLKNLEKEIRDEVASLIDYEGLQNLLEEGSLTSGLLNPKNLIEDSEEKVSELVKSLKLVKEYFELLENFVKDYDWESNDYIYPDEYDMDPNDGVL